MSSRNTQYPQTRACGANMEPEDFVQGKWVSERGKVGRTRQSGHRALVARKGLRSNLRKVLVMEGCDSRPHKPAWCEVLCREEREVRILATPKPLSGASGRKVPPTRERVLHGSKRLADAIHGEWWTRGGQHWRDGKSNSQGRGQGAL